MHVARNADRYFSGYKPVIKERKLPLANFLLFGSWLYSLAWLMARVYGSFLFYSRSNVGEEISLLADGQGEWYSMVKLKAQWFRCLQYSNFTYYSSPTRCASGASLRTAFQLVLVS